MAGLSLQPVFTVGERSQLVGAVLTPDTTSGAYASTDFGAFLFRIGTSGETSVVVAQLDNTMASAPDWSPLKPQAMKILGRIIYEKGESVALTTQYGGSVASWAGALTLRFRRAD